MRKMLIAAAALMFCAAPAAAQMPASHATTPLAAAQADAPKPAQDPALYPTTDQVKADVRANEARLGQRQQVGSHSWWYLVAAIAVGVIVAALVL